MLGAANPKNDLTPACRHSGTGTFFRPRPPCLTTQMDQPVEDRSRELPFSAAPNLGGEVTDEVLGNPSRTATTRTCNSASLLGWLTSELDQHLGVHTQVLKSLDGPEACARSTSAADVQWRCICDRRGRQFHNPRWGWMSQECRRPDWSRPLEAKRFSRVHLARTRTRHLTISLPALDRAVARIWQLT